MLQLEDINHVVYCHPDLDVIERFLTDFGLVVAQRTEQHLYMRGAGSLPYVYVAERAERASFGAIAFAVKGMADLEQASRLPGASRIEALEGPGGGQRVSLTDPAGRRIDLVHGIEPVQPLSIRPGLTHNTAIEKRRLGVAQRPPKGPAQVLRIGHAAIGVRDLHTNLEWYTRTLGLLPSDLVVEGGKDNPVAAFLRINRGSEWTDHHTIALFTADEDRIHHASFEVQDFDAQCQGHHWMVAQGWSPFWGVGRHLLGSQIFDYWLDPSGNIIEHFTDGDQYNQHSPLGYTASCDSSLYQWGPQMSVENFLGGVCEIERNARR
ncbi:2,4,5-trihydroxytoluene oxygenase [Pseudomonas sp. LS1212]|uniref:2,4,5-trihydroxytoluene oxygenase n=1 Tax=Pseudomonas sp. LS1212 TaxID=2972478 RepID=UPI00215CF725|nr:2,4,5-trihydroxytoluene oxygenase [Pseudomonas sp. LS1212]UVJ46230.1 2,4,5-trihydroxytoluene oxygenase [Pseudomonas sp. LS1212]